MNAAERRSADERTNLGAARWLAPLMRATESIVICDTEGAVLFWNESSERLYGWDGADVLGRSLAAIGRDVRSVDWEKALSDGHWSGVTRRRRRDGTEIDVHLRCEMMSLWGDRGANVVVEYGYPACKTRPLIAYAQSHLGMDTQSQPSMRRNERHSSQVEVTISDFVSQLDHAQELEARADHDQRLIDSMPLAVWQVDASIMGEVLSELRKEGVSDILAYIHTHPELIDFAIKAVKVIAANELALALLGGVTNDQLLGPVGYLFKAAPSAVMNIMAARFSGRRMHTQQMQVATFDGRVVDVMFMVSYPHAAFDKTMLVMADISDRVRIESQLKQIEADFARATRLSTLGEMVGSIVHEVRQPLSAIMTDGETSLRWLERSDINVAKLRQISARIVESASQAGDIVDKIREMAVRQAPVTGEVSFNDIVLQAVKFVRGECDAKSVDVISQLDPDLPTITGDAIQLQQVVVNLLMNALYATGTTQGARREIRLRTSKEGAAAFFFVEDSGPGIPSDNFGKIFDRFFSTKEGGMGMGLAICKSIVNAHGGTITASNASSGGAVLTVTLPAAMVGKQT